MSDIVQYLNLSSVGSAALCLLVGLMFIKPPPGWFRWIIVGIAALAIAAPIVQVRTTLGLPSPWLEDGRYRLLGWKTDEDAGQIYVMVNHPLFDSPMEFQLPFDLKLALELQEIRAENDFEELICMQLDRSGQDRPPVELRRIQAAVNDLFQSCDLLWIDDRSVKPNPPAR